MPFLFLARKWQLHGISVWLPACVDPEPTTLNEWWLLFRKARADTDDIEGSMNHRSTTMPAVLFIPARGNRSSTVARRIIQGMENNLWQALGTTKHHPDAELLTPCNIASTSCSAPVISLFLAQRKDPSNVLTLPKSRNNLSHLAVDRPRHMAILPVFLPVSRETANRDEFADDCLHRQSPLISKALLAVLDLSVYVFVDDANAFGGGACPSR